MALSHINGLGQRTSPYTKNNSSADEITNPVEDFGVGGITLEHGDIKRTFDEKKRIYLCHPFLVRMADPAMCDRAIIESLNGSVTHSRTGSTYIAEYKRLCPVAKSPDR